MTFGPIISDLAVRYGQPLDPWQRDAQDILCAVNPTSGLWACSEYAEIVPRQNGKGGIGEPRALGGMLLLGEDLIMWSAHQYKTAMEAFRRTLGHIRRMGIKHSDTLYEVDDIPIKVSNTNGEEGFERLDTGQRIRFIARSSSSGRGFSGDVNFIDEAFAYTPEQHEALLPTVSARPNPQFIYLSTPPLTGDTAKVMYGLRRRAEAGGDETLGYRDWGLPGTLEDLDKVGVDGRRPVDLDDVELWKRTNPATASGRLTVPKIAVERRSFSITGFARERLGMWPREITGGAGVISTELWQSLTTEPARPAHVAFAVDVNPARTHAAIVSCGALPDGRLLLSVVDYRPGIDWIPARLAGLREQWRPVAICLDSKSPAASLLLDLDQRGIRLPDNPERPLFGDLAVPTAGEVAAGFGLFVDAARERRLAHVGDAPLNVALAGAQTRPLSGGSAWDRKAEADICPLVAATLAHWAYVTRIDLVAEYDLMASFY